MPAWPFKCILYLFTYIFKIMSHCNPFHSFTSKPHSPLHSSNSQTVYESFQTNIGRKKNGLKTNFFLQIWQLCDHHHNMTQASSESHLFYSIRHHIFAKEPWISVPMHRTYQSLYSTTNKTIQQIFELCCLFCSSSCHQWQSKLLHSLFTLVSSTLKNKPDV